MPAKRIEDQYPLMVYDMRNGISYIGHIDAENEQTVNLSVCTAVPTVYLVSHPKLPGKHNAIRELGIALDSGDATYRSLNKNQVVSSYKITNREFEQYGKNRHEDKQLETDFMPWRGDLTNKLYLKELSKK